MKPIRPIEQPAWLTAIVIGLALSVLIVPPIWLGYAGLGLYLVFGLGLAVTFFAFFLAEIDGMRLQLSKFGVRVFAVIYSQITAVFFMLFLVGKAAAG